MINLSSGPSFTSRVLDKLGRALIGSPQALGLGPGFEDFYFLAGDRVIVKVDQSTKILFERITVNNFRRMLFTRVATVASVCALVICMAGVLTLKTMRGASDLAHQLTTSVERAPVFDPPECVALKKLYATQSMTPEQLKRFRACGQ